VDVLDGEAQSAHEVYRLPASSRSASKIPMEGWEPTYASG
jgi:hypothetical protein